MIYIFTLLFAFVSEAIELKVGDVLLQPLDCWSCSLIEAQERSIYSHMGIVLEVNPDIRIAEALGNVRAMSLSEFNQRTQKGQFLSVRRLQSKGAQKFLESHHKEFLSLFQNYFEGLKYDHDFLWNNFDDDGYEKMYCSEFVSKLFQAFLGLEIPLKKMKFDVNRDEWIKYFKGNPPDGKWGNSPATFENSELFYEVGEI